MNKLVSVIIPVYNAELWIENAIKNIIGQTYSNWELIIVDDGSTDKSKEICKVYSERDSRIKLICKENGGPGSARNVGLDNIKGDYFIMIDSDDILYKDALETFIKKADDTNADVVISGYSVNDISAEKTINYCVEREQFISFKDDKQLELLIQHNLMASNWNKFYSNRLSSLRFDESITINEDVIFSLKAVKKANRIISIPNTLYEYIFHSQESLSTKFHPELPKTLDEMDSILSDEKNKVSSIIIKRWLMDYLFVYFRMVCLKTEIDNERKELIKLGVDSKVFKKYGKIVIADTFLRKLSIILLKMKAFKFFINLMKRKGRA